MAYRICPGIIRSFHPYNTVEVWIRQKKHRAAPQKPRATAWEGAISVAGGSFVLRNMRVYAFGHKSLSETPDTW